jgi:hypothetical protein
MFFYFWQGLTQKLIFCFASLHKKQLITKHIEANKKHIHWSELSLNKSAIRLLVENPNKIVWSELAGNPNIDKIIKIVNTEEDNIYYTEKYIEKYGN